MINIQLFKFDSKTDYLPYYKSYSIKHDSIDTLDDVLKSLYAIEKFGFIENEDFFLLANNKYTSSKALLSDILNDSNELILEPLSIKRAINDLIIDTKDYQAKLDLLDKYMSADEKETIIKNKSYMLEYYASNTLHFNDDYIGEHVILLGLDIAKKDDSLQNDIFSILNSEDGLINKSSLQYRILNYPEKKESKKNEPYDIIQSFENFNIAVYDALNPISFEYVVEQSNAIYVNLKSKHFDIPFDAKKLSYLMAGTILLEALDNNADFLIVNTGEDLSLFDAKQKQIEKTMGREINLPVLTRGQFIKLLSGEKDKNTLGLNNHKVKLPFLD